MRRYLARLYIDAARQPERVATVPRVKVFFANLRERFLRLHLAGNR